MSQKQIGFLHPGKMGVSIAANILRSSHQIWWCSKSRSEQTNERAQSIEMLEANNMKDLVSECSIIFSICPPEYALDVAKEVIGSDFKGIFIDANAISHEKAKLIDELMKAANISFVDGAIIGGPAWKKGTTLYLSGTKANEIKSCFSDEHLEVSIISDVPGKASALKMCFAAYTKGSTALLSAILASADTFDVRDELEAQWAKNGDEYLQSIHRRVQVGAQKAWRFSGEMKEVASTFKEAGQPDGLHLSAFDVFNELKDFKNQDPAPSIEQIIKALRNYE